MVKALGGMPGAGGGVFITLLLTDNRQAQTAPASWGKSSTSQLLEWDAASGSGGSRCGPCWCCACSSTIILPQTGVTKAHTNTTFLPINLHLCDYINFGQALVHILVHAVVPPAPVLSLNCQHVVSRLWPINLLNKASSWLKDRSILGAVCGKTSTESVVVRVMLMPSCLARSPQQKTAPVSAVQTLHIK